MQMVQDSFAEQLARLFHSYRELLASDFGYQSSEGCCAWEELLPSQRNLMIATSRLVLLHLAAEQHSPLPFGQKLSRDREHKSAA